MPRCGPLEPGDRVVPEGGFVSRRLGHRAQALGHDVTVVHRTGKVQRFVLRCSCGFATNAGWTRKHTFDAVVEHLTEVVQLGVSLTDSVGPRVEDSSNDVIRSAR